MTHHPTKQRLLDAGLAMLLEHGYHDLGIQALLAATGTPKGSFYHASPSAWSRPDNEATSRRIPIRSAWRACWSTAGRGALRSRVRGSAAPLTAMLNFYFRSAVEARDKPDGRRGEREGGRRA